MRQILFSVPLVLLPPLAEAIEIPDLPRRAVYVNIDKNKVTAKLTLEDGYTYLEISTVIKNRCSGNITSNIVNALTDSPEILEYGGPSIGGTGPKCKVRAKFSSDGEILALEEDPNSECAEYRGRDCAFTGSLRLAPYPSPATPTIKPGTPFGEARKMLITKGWDPKGHAKRTPCDNRQRLCERHVEVYFCDKHACFAHFTYGKHGLRVKLIGQGVATGSLPLQVAEIVRCSATNRCD